MSLRIGIDGEALRKPLSGVGKYVFHLSRELSGLLPQAEFFLYTRLAPERHELPSERFVVRRETSPAWRRVPSFLWLKTRGKALCAADGLDVFWAGRTLHPRLAGAVRTLCTVHDLNHLIVPETMQRSTRWSHRLWFGGDVACADAVTTNSAGTAERLQRLLGVSDVSVIRPGIEAEFHPFAPAAAEAARASLAELGIRAPYLLCVATLEPCKNVETLLRSFLDLKRTGKLADDYRLVLVGASGWQNKALALELARASGQGVVVAGYVPDSLMPAIYALAEALICPSIYEGFGMPVLEARACGTRVVVANSPELREAGGPHAFAAEPTVAGVTDGIERALAVPWAKETTVGAEYTWRRSAERLASVIDGG